MPYVYANVRKLEKHAKVGDSECVALIRQYTSAPAAVLWRKGEAVIGDRALASGTAIATFVNEKWPTKPHGNHAALFTTRRNKKVRIDTYDLSPPHPGGIWMKCGYGASNEITLHKRLNDNVTQCTISQNNASPSEIEIVCR